MTPTETLTPTEREVVLAMMAAIEVHLAQLREAIAALQQELADAREALAS